MLYYYLFNKPYQVLSQFTKEGDKQTLADYFPSIPKDVYPVGRLDYDSEGLLLLTNDKPLTNRLLNPSFAHPRTYWVQVEGIITQEAIKELEKGVLIAVEGKKYKTKEAKATIITNEIDIPARNPPIRFRKNVPDSWLSLTLIEGKNRQVRKMTASVGFPTLRLIRYAIGNLNLSTIAVGNYIKLDEKTKDLLLKQ